MLDFSDKPYQFFPPTPRALVIAVAKQLNRRFVLPGPKHRIKQIELRGADRVLPLLTSNSRCLFLPNHSTHSDPQLMLEVQRRLRISAATMAAYDVFLRGKRQACFMQSIGCFSIDREGSDSQAMKCAVDLLINGDRPLTIFPEGNVLLMNDRVSPFLDGAAFVAMRAQKKLGNEAPIFAIPIAIKLSHVTDCRHVVIEHVVKLENQLGLEPKPEDTARQRLRRIGLSILSRNLRQRGYLPPAEDNEDLNQVLASSALQIISNLEEKIDLGEAASACPTERIRRIRSAIHQVRIDDEQQFDHRIAATWADEAILALRILSYSGDYLGESPTLDRHGETLEKLREDLTEKMLPPLGDRVAIIQLAEPMNLADRPRAKSSRQALADLTREWEAAVQAGLDEINASNTAAGGEFF